MPRFDWGQAVILVLAFTVGCDKDSRTPEVLGPNTGTELVSADRSDRDDDNGFSGNDKIAIRDDCDPRDPAWAPTGGCLLRRGDVTFAEFNAENNSLLAAAVVGHQAWRNDPSYVKIETRKTLRVRNEGGRVHTFTEVAMFGGGKVPSPALNKGLVTAPECPGSRDIPPGGGVQLSNLAPGNHRFQCCIHPWMRAVIKVRADDHRGHNDH